MVKTHKRGEYIFPDLNKENYCLNFEYAKNLAMYLWQNFYKEDSPDWKPLNNMQGILMQIDNMLTGMTRKQDCDCNIQGFSVFHKPGCGNFE